LDREAIVLAHCFVRLKIVDPSGSITLGRLWAASEPDISRCPQAYSRYRELYIPPASVARSTTRDDVGSTCRQIESNQSPGYTAAAARVLCAGEFPPASDDGEIVNGRWELGASVQSRDGRRAPYLTKIKVMGAFLNDGCDEFIPTRKRRRHQDIHEWGWS
jgi:hypothetical protein